MNSPWLSFSATGSAPRASTQHGTLPLANRCCAYHCTKSREACTSPRRKSPATIIAPSRTQLRAYERVPGCSAAPSRDIRMCASELRTVSTTGCAAAGSVRPTRFSRSRHCAATASSRLRAQVSSARVGGAASPASGNATATLRVSPAARSNAQRSAALARPCVSLSACSGRCAVASTSTSPLSSASATTPVGGTNACSHGRALTTKVPACHASRSTRLTPPGVLRNCAGGFTCHGRCTSASVSRRAVSPVLVSV
jgi:hypothetical protein